MSTKLINRTKWLNTRLTPDEYKSITESFKKTRFRKMSEYSRNVLLGKNITVTHRDKSMDEVLEELILLRKEINFVGNNFNQAVRKLNSVNGMPDAHIWQAMLSVLRDELEPSISQIKVKVNQYSEIWLQKLSAEKV